MGNGIFYYSGNQDTRHRKGVGILLSEKVVPSVINFLPYSDRAALMRIRAKPVDLNIIQVYAPTSDSTEQELEQFYSDIRDLLRLTKNHEVTLIMGDFNAKLGKGKFEDIVGPFGLGERNERGDRLLQFCQEERMKVANTWFKHHPRRLYTWKSPADQPENIVRNQIDFVLVNSRFGSAIKNAYTYPGADVPSDHNLLTTTVKISLSNGIKTKPKQLLALERLQDPNIKLVTADQINTKIETITPRIETDNVTQSWDNIVNIIRDTAHNTLGFESKGKKQKWMTDEILLLMDQRRKYKSDKNKYNELQRTIRSKIRIAKNEWLKNECDELGELYRRHDSFTLHKKLKETAGVYRRRNPDILVDQDGKIILENSDKMEMWERYIKTLFNSERTQETTNSDGLLTGPSITREEIEYTIHKAKNNKAVGPDEIPSELLKLMDERGIDALHRLFNKIYDTGSYPEQWLSSVFIPLPKKNNSRTCEDHRLISLMSHALKIFLKIIHRRIFRKCERVMSESQFGFRQGLGTREAIVATQVLIQNCYDQRKNVCLCFIDYEKAFDKVQHHKLIAQLRKLDLDEKDIRCIKNLYWHQNAKVRVGNEVTRALQIQKGVRQGCVLSPLLFNLYSEAIFQEALEDTEIGIKVNGTWINNIRYADDAVLIADSMDKLQQLLDIVGQHSNTMGLNINTKKTKFMVVTRDENAFNNSELTFDGKSIERVECFKYLGTWLSKNWTSDKEIKCRIEQARVAFIKLRRIFTCTDFDLELRLRFVDCYIWPVLLYGAEGWTLKTNMINKLEAFEMWVYRRILKIPWTAKIRNEEVLRRINKDRQLFDTIKKRKTAYFGHIMRNEKYNFLQLIIEGKIEGRRGIGRKKMSWLRNIRQWTGLHNIQTLIHTARDRVAMENVVANIH